jgi:hypothetical protein
MMEYGNKSLTYDTVFKSELKVKYFIGKWEGRKYGFGADSEVNKPEDNVKLRNSIKRLD